MTYHFSPPAPSTTEATAILIDAARCWRQARDSGEPVQPCLARTLSAHNGEILAPVLDSLIYFYEAALGRSFTPGAAMLLSEDEHLLLGLFDRSAPQSCIGCAEETATALNCALCSTRVMLALTFADRTATLQ